MSGNNHVFVAGDDVLISDIRQQGIKSQLNLQFCRVPAVMAVVCLLMMAPLISIVLTATGDTGNLMPHLFQTVLARYVGNTLLLMVGVGSLAIIFGVSTAWVVSRYHFPFRYLFEWLLVLPAAMPAYIIAYSYTDFLEYAGPLQTGLRQIFGWQTSRDYWFPEIRSAMGASILMSAVLYPYIYLLTRTAFRQTSTQMFEVAALAGRPVFWSIALPLARPAIIAGLALVLMEVVSDFGTVEYFALETLTLGIFNVWLGMNNMPAAAQLALCAFILVGALLMIEIFARSRRSFQNVGIGKLGVPIINPSLAMKWLCFVTCLIPVVVGFFGPVSILLSFVLLDGPFEARLSMVKLTQDSFTLAISVGIGVMTLSILVGLLATYRSGQLGQILAGMAASGYAFPGTILAIGVLSFTGFLDQLLVLFTVDIFLTGSLFVLLFGLMIRFHAVGYGAITSGLKRMPPHMMESGLILGHSFGGTVQRVIMPILHKSIIAGGLLVFVDVMKELPLTLLLRPFSFETYATFTYQYAKDEMLEAAAAPALMIVCAGLIPVFIANRALKT